MHTFRALRLCNRNQAPSLPIHFLLLCFMALMLAACGKSAPAAVSAQASQATEVQNASLALQPASGYGGLYVQVNGVNWPQNMLVLVTLEDEAGRSETLAASDTDQAGNLTTGFLFPIDQRWLASKSPFVVTTSADGAIEVKAQFTVVAPGAEIIAEAPSPAVKAGIEQSASSDKPSKPVTDTVAAVEEEAAHTLVLPLISNSGQPRGGRVARDAGGSGEVAQVDVDIDPGGSKSIDCRNGNEWITVAIYSSGGFDATAVDPGSVIVSGGDLGYGGEATTHFVALQGRSRQAYQWRWHLDDVDGDGATDMVLEFSLGYTELGCGATEVAVTGRTKDGKRFEGTNRVDMLVLERS